MMSLNHGIFAIDRLLGILLQNLFRWCNWRNFNRLTLKYIIKFFLMNAILGLVLLETSRIRVLELIISSLTIIFDASNEFIG